MIPNIHLLGIQGSGKGTQSALLVDQYSASYIASGNLFRQRSTVHDACGLRIKSLMRGGKLLPDDLVVSTVQEELVSHPPGHLLLCDGVIRTLEQLAMFDPIWQSNGLDEPTLIYLDLSETIARQRVAGREAERHLPEKQAYHAKFSGKLIQREDDNPQALDERFRLFRNMTEPIVNSFQKRGRLVTVPANLPINEVHLQVCAAISTFYPSFV